MAIDKTWTQNKDWLHDHYWVKGLTIPEISELTEVPITTINARMRKFGIPRRTKSEAFSGTRSYMFGKTMPKEIREKISKAHTGKHTGPNNNMFGKHHSKEHKRKQSESIKQTIQKNGCAMTGRFGEASNNWQGGKTCLNKQIRTSKRYISWRNERFKRDDYTCQICSKRGNKMHVDHIVPLSVLLSKLDIKTIYEANKLDCLWNTSNGRTLCVECHKNTDTWGTKAKQFRIS